MGIIGVSRRPGSHVRGGRKRIKRMRCHLQTPPFCGEVAGGYHPALECVGCRPRCDCIELDLCRIGVEQTNVFFFGRFLPIIVSIFLPHPLLHTSSRPLRSKVTATGELSKQNDSNPFPLSTWDPMEAMPPSKAGITRPNPPSTERTDPKRWALLPSMPSKVRTPAA